MTSLLHHLLSLILLTPIAGALAILAVRGRRPNGVRWMANACAGAAFVAALPLWFLYEPHGKTWQFAERGELIASIGVSYYVGVDGFSISLILLTTFMTWLATLASWTEIGTRVRAFYACMLILEASLLGAFMALDFLLFYLSWVVMLAAMYCLIRLWGARRPRESAVTFVIFTSVASGAVLAGILALVFANYSATGIYSFDITLFHTIDVPPPVQKWAFVAFLAGFAARVPLFPLHAWFADAQTNAPTGASVMLTAVMLKIGTYGFIRFSLPILPEASRSFVPAIAVLAMGGAVYGAILALAQRDPKRLVAYWSISQMSLVMLGLCALTPAAITGSLVQQISHGISAGALLLIASVVVSPGTREIPAHGAPLRTTPVVAAVFLVITLSAVGLPAFSGFVGQKLLLQAVYAANGWWGAAAAAGVAIGAVSLLRLYWRTVSAPTDGGNTLLRGVTGRELATLLPPAAVAVAIGLYPAPVLSRLETSVGRVAARVTPAYAPFVQRGSDCATPAAPDPAGPPPVFVLVEPCADASAPAPGDTSPSQPPGKSR